MYAGDLPIYNPPHTVKYFCMNPELQNDRVKLRDQWAAEEAYMQREFTRAIQAVRNIQMQVDLRS